jgi:hypothetical protein
VLLEVPIAAIRGYLQRHERPAAIVDDLITKTYEAVVGRQKVSD